MTSGQPIPQNTIDEFVGVDHGDFARLKALLDQYPGLLNASATWNDTAIQAATQTGRVDIANTSWRAAPPWISAPPLCWARLTRAPLCWMPTPPSRKPPARTASPSSISRSSAARWTSPSCSSPAAPR